MGTHENEERSKQRRKHKVERIPLPKGEGRVDLMAEEFVIIASER